MKKGDRVLVWDEKKAECLGWGKVVEVTFPFAYQPKKSLTLVLLDESKKRVFGDRYQFIPEKKALEISKRIYRDLEKVEREK